MSNKHNKAKGSVRKSAGATKGAATIPLDRNDPRVRALADDLIRETIQKADLRIAAHRQQKKQAEKEAAQKRKAAAEAEAKKPLTADELVKRMSALIDPLVAIYETANLAVGANNYESLQTVVVNLSMLCLKRIDACMERNGGGAYGFAEDWLYGIESAE